MLRQRFRMSGSGSRAGDDHGIRICDSRASDCLERQLHLRDQAVCSLCGEGPEDRSARDQSITKLRASLMPPARARTK